MIFFFLNWSGMFHLHIFMSTTSAFWNLSNYMQPPQYPIQGDNHCPSPPGHIRHLRGDIHVKIYISTSALSTKQSHKVAQSSALNSCSPNFISQRKHSSGAPLFKEELPSLSSPLHSISQSKH